MKIYKERDFITYKACQSAKRFETSAENVNNWLICFCNNPLML